MVTGRQVEEQHQPAWLTERPLSDPAPHWLSDAFPVRTADIAVLRVVTPLFQFDGVPPGVYFVRLRSLAGSVTGPASDDVMIVVGDVPAPPSEPRFLTSTVTGNVVTLTWDEPMFGSATAYVLEAGSMPGASDIAVLNTVGDGRTFVVPGVPPGRYFLRVRALNARGQSAQSTEHELVVP